MNDLHAIVRAAEEYARRGWSVIPVRADKKPAIRSWKHLQSNAPKPEEVSAWFGRVKGCAGVGIVLGAVSGHLWVRDFDDPDLYSRWRDLHPDLATTLPTVRTSRGLHVYGRWQGVPSLKCDGGELRSEGNYVVAPPSAHVSGTVYQWVVPLSSGEVPLCDPFAVGLAASQSLGARACATERTEKTERTEDTEKPERTEDTEATEDPEVIWGDAERRSTIESVIARTIPSGLGRRNEHIFRLARSLKAIEGLAAVSGPRVRLLRPIVKEWHRRAQSQILTKDLATTWGDFCHAWERVRFAVGADILGAAIADAESADPPTWAAEYSPACQLLASICRELQRRAGGAPFFLSAATAGRAVGVDKGTANRWLTAFMGDGAIVLVSKGSAQSGRASRYRYVASDLCLPSGK
ncbi:MAG: bifunctional DNA primase/polymerase [Phycisphaeraceae bacterium]|nr:bifunctional DNA primase/polymerase [Phycisphaeraceae bacterium]